MKAKETALIAKKFTKFEMFDMFFWAKTHPTFLNDLPMVLTHENIPFPEKISLSKRKSDFTNLQKMFEIVFLSSPWYLLH